MTDFRLPLLRTAACAMLAAGLMTLTAVQVRAAEPEEKIVAVVNDEAI